MMVTESQQYRNSSLKAPTCCKFCCRFKTRINFFLLCLCLWWLLPPQPPVALLKSIRKVKKIPGAEDWERIEEEMMDCGGLERTTFTVT